MRPIRFFVSSVRRGFALIELLVVAGIVGLLASLLVAGLRRVKGQGESVLCTANARQLIFAWMMYASDNDDRLVSNAGRNRVRRTTSANLDFNWVNNVLDWQVTPSNTNQGFAARTPFRVYLGVAPRLFRCPADRSLSEVQRAAGWSARARSFAMNGMVGHPWESFVDGANAENPGFRQFLRCSDLPSPGEIFVFIEEHADSINDGSFLNKATDLVWTDLPSARHQGSGTLAFADGHGGLHRWKDPNTARLDRPEAAGLPFPARAGETDFSWLANSATVPQ